MPLAPGGSAKLRVRSSVPIASKPLANSIKIVLASGASFQGHAVLHESGNPVRVSKPALGVERHHRPRASL